MRHANRVRVWGLSPFLRFARIFGRIRDRGM